MTTTYPYLGIYTKQDGVPVNTERQFVVMFDAPRSGEVVSVSSNTPQVIGLYYKNCWNEADFEPVMM